MKTPQAATVSTSLKGAALAPTAEFKKFTASLLTPTNRSIMAKTPRKTRIIVKRMSIQFSAFLFVYLFLVYIA